MAKITLIGMNNYTEGHIWDGLAVPSQMSKETFINTIMFQYGEMETLFSDPEAMAFAIQTWSNKNNWSMVKAAAAINVSYDPLNNYDRTETRSRTESGTNTGTVTDSGNTSVTSTTSGTNANEHTVSAYDSSSYSADNKDEGSTSGSGISTGTDSNTRTDNLAHSNTESESIRAYGNIGVTTSQQMLESELNVSLYNIYDTFAGIFAYDLLLMVY